MLAWLLLFSFTHITTYLYKLSLILSRMGLTLHQSHGHGHSHNHESEDHSSYTATVGVESSDTSEDSEEQKLIHKKKANINVRAAFIHVIGDLVQSLGVLTAAFIIYFKVTIFFLWLLQNDQLCDVFVIKVASKGNLRPFESNICIILNLI